MARPSRLVCVVAASLCALAALVHSAPALATEDPIPPTPPLADDAAAHQPQGRPAAGAIGAVVGAGAGFTVASTATAAVWGAGLLMASMVPGPGAGFWAVYTVVALTTPGLLVVLPALGAGLAAHAAVVAHADAAGAATVGLAAGLTTVALAAVGGVTGLLIGGAAGIVSAGGGFGQSALAAAMLMGGAGAVVGAGASAALGAAAGGAYGTDELVAGIE